MSLPQTSHTMRWLKYVCIYVHIYIRVISCFWKQAEEGSKFIRAESAVLRLGTHIHYIHWNIYANIFIHTCTYIHTYIRHHREEERQHRPLFCDLQCEHGHRRNRGRHIERTLVCFSPVHICMYVCMYAQASCWMNVRRYQLGPVKALRCPWLPTETAVKCHPDSPNPHGMCVYVCMWICVYVWM